MYDILIPEPPRVSQRIRLGVTERALEGQAGNLKKRGKLFFGLSIEEDEFRGRDDLDVAVVAEEDPNLALVDAVRRQRARRGAGFEPGMGKKLVIWAFYFTYGRPILILNPF